MKLSKSCQTIHALIEESALKRPDVVAVSCDGVSITYKNMILRSNQLANYLIEKGVEPKDFVAISMLKNIDIIISIIAILKIGCIYVPVDSNYPESHLSHILENSKAKYILTHEEIAKKISFFNMEKIVLDSELEEIKMFPMSAPSIKTRKEDLAYLLYTSGTTGQPKGVLVDHESVILRFTDWKDAYNLTEKDSHLQMASYSFDVFIGDMVRALGSGAKLVLVPKKALMIPELLYSLMVSENVNIGEFVPFVLKNLLEYVETMSFSLSFMRIIVSGSDNLTFYDYGKVKGYCGETTRVINSYGTTEAVIDSTFFEVDDALNQVASENVCVPIGKPFPSCEVYLINDSGVPVQKGEVGELYIGGKGIAKGYFDLPELTNKKFIMKKLGSEYKRLYKTGDLGLILPSGDISLLGRKDRQIKIRGVRIELSEIEATIKKFEPIKDALVYKVDENESCNQLIAYLVINRLNELDYQELRKFLRSELPSYMVPAVYKEINVLPITANGKIDRLNRPRKNSLLKREVEI